MARPPNDQDESDEKRERIARQIEPIEAVNGRSGQGPPLRLLWRSPVRLACGLRGQLAGDQIRPFEDQSERFPFVPFVLNRNREGDSPNPKRRHRYANELSPIAFENQHFSRIERVY